MNELQEQVREREARGEPRIVEQVASSAVKGALGELDDPARKEQFGRMVSLAAENAVGGAVGALDGRIGWMGGPSGANGAALATLGDRFSAGLTRGFSRELRLELGTNGEGPLAQSLAGLLHQASAAAATSLIAELSSIDSQCAGEHCADRQDRQDRHDRRVYELTHAAAAGFTDGVVQRLRLPTIAISFGAGLVAALAITGLLHRSRRDAHGRS